ncbi:hypothetical protein [Breoghania sp. L-A4]|uniref:hypothetical protein n=1 Tax=Breoghania sp. L-A4 TaxID=2304600 RepID=UPI000E35B005|nr:hypothetical protein [Breoghania sp. L-A4]AXS42415.1 hypothetical protein D1F64_03710 [Breoghania sp. L-A4]
MKLICRCLPGYETLLPRPVAASRALPDWLRAMPAQAQSETLGGAEVRTLKQCPPVLDAMQAGIIFPLAADVTVEGGQFSWDWDPPAPHTVHEAARLTRSPIGVHAPEQAQGAPFAMPDGQFVIKFNNFWTVEAPEGWSLLISHPFNREDLPFRTLAGLVDVDTFCNGFVHFPALWTDPDFSGVLKAGTPVAQAVPVRREALELDFEAMDAEHLAAHIEIQDGLQADPGLYRKNFRAKREK